MIDGVTRLTEDLIRLFIDYKNEVSFLEGELTDVGNRVSFQLDEP